MSPKTTVVAVPNCILFIRGAPTMEVPEIERGKIIWTTPSCIAVGCMPDCDGDINITIGPAQDIGIGEALVLDGVLETPSRMVSVEIVLHNTILEHPVSGRTPRVRLWTNDDRTSDEVVIGLGG